jgi:hypothetical protein
MGNVPSVPRFPGFCPQVSCPQVSVPRFPEGKEHLLRLLQEIPLGEAEQAAVEDGLAAYENLLSRLVDVPTPAGPTPRQIGVELVQITSVRPALAVQQPY